jgi:hypothetical protein
VLIGLFLNDAGGKLVAKLWIRLDLVQKGVKILT